MSNSSDSDTPTHYRSIDDLTDEKLDEEVLRLHARRLRAYEAFREAQELKLLQMHERQQERLTKLFEMYKKELDRADKAIEKVEMRLAKIRAMRLEIEEN